ncbi:hypothetical protein ABTY61_20790 [Kitasatospora sp. NPDC096128]|uniref:hypothetical protein n=1 Tax=Kitasatospora sp. NPDC096128 TaxID=3155547 RepID=UPI003326E00E
MARDPAHSAAGGTAIRVCAGVACRGAEDAGRARRLAAAGSRLCPACGDRLLAELRRLPRLYEECGLRLGGPEQSHERTSGGPLPGMPFNTAAAEARSSILAVLRAWASLVVDERRVGVPRGSTAGLVDFLLPHSGWLTAHSAAGELSEEVAALVRRARRVIDPSPARRVTVGGCVEADCSGGLTAVPQDRRPGLPAEISCDAVPSHRWPAEEWLMLSRLLAQRGSGAPASTVAAAAGQDDVRWVSAGQIARLWGIAPGSVYRHASEQQWRRRAARGRTYYHDADVRRTLDGRKQPARERGEKGLP